MTMKKIALYLFLALMPFAAISEDKTFAWDFPTTRTDGSILDAAELAETRIYCDDILLQAIPAPETTLTIDLPTTTQRCAATTVDKGGLESDYSNWVDIPYAPGAPTITITITVLVN